MTGWSIDFHRKRVETYNAAVLAGLSSERAAAEAGSLRCNVIWSANKVGLKMMNPKLVRRAQCREAIAKIVAKNKRAGATEISKTLKVSVRTICRHLAVLRPTE